ncbi:cysteinyl tRNA synthetase, cytoplasmic [Trichuris trichiura]|uniref:Cysteine--tRNA ligase, cytoplasmic n=1 Tax=Trichuris trichiura TaxID=36087 RepID=A0A077ZCX7_TRITR|nr:cysteinyl tRNA synthetase, cytoplasmic [Trichuris trichiura]
MAQERGEPPKWTLPVNDPMCQLKLYNSLTRRKELFIPINGNQVTWYICGPTVYDVAHMGHARSYISFDILRRVLKDYFGYDVLYVMNITDIDDKIIKRARQKHLLEKYLQSEPSTQAFLNDVKNARQEYVAKMENEPNEDKKNMYRKQLEKLDTSLAAFENVFAQHDEATISLSKQQVVTAGADMLSEWLDSGQKGTVSDHSIFDALSRFYEEDFNKDMAALNVLPADVLTRVSEYVPEIVAFVEKIIQKGFAYEANGSVYFDTVAFGRAIGHRYGKLVPGAVADADLLQSAMREGEGELSIGVDRLQEKRNTSDFALWKASKPGEPFWESPWGYGRPGWHIECSVMATAICGQKLDIHSGGFDLRFPHHDNELAQTEAYYGIDQWVNYFLHAGTLKIAGLKMSKSLKNFITIKQCLKEYTARQLRLLFLMHNWSDTLDYSRQSMELAIQFERLCSEFFLTVSHYVRKHFDRCLSTSFVKLGRRELILQQHFKDAKFKVHKALCDSVDTRTALDTVRELVGQCNIYINEESEARRVPCCLLLRNVALYITKLMRIFGVTEMVEEIGKRERFFNCTDATNNISNALGFLDAGKGSASKEQLVMPYLNVLSEFRERVREEAREHKIGTLLEECDRLRDEILVDLGVRLEDRKGETVVKLVDRDELLKEREQKIRLEEEKRLRKEKLASVAEAKRKEKENQRRLPPNEMFLREKDKYSAFDRQGIPTHDFNGEEITMTKKQKTRKRKFKDMDQIHEELNRDIEDIKRGNFDEDLPGQGQHPCVECDRMFENDDVLKKHRKSKAHKRRVKNLARTPKYTQQEADAAAGLGTYCTPTKNDVM